MSVGKKVMGSWIKAGALALGLVFVPALSTTALADPGDVRVLSDGGLLVEVINKKPQTMRPMLASAVGGAMRYDDDETAQRALMQVMRQAGPNWLEAVAVAAAHFSPDRASLIAAAAMETDSANGLKAAQAMRHVRGVRKQQILLGVHSSGNRQAYKALRRNFNGNETDSMLADSIGRSVGPASVDAPRPENPLGFDRNKPTRGIKLRP